MIAIASFTLSTLALTWLNHPLGGMVVQAQARHEVSYTPTITTPQVGHSPRQSAPAQQHDALLGQGIGVLHQVQQFLTKGTRTHCATIRPRYSGSCSQRDPKITQASGDRRGVGLAVDDIGALARGGERGG